MKKFILLFLVIGYFIDVASAQEKEKLSDYMVGFSAVLPRGPAPATALTNSGESIKNSFGFGVVLQKEVMKNLSLFLDGNMYNYNVFLAGKGEDVQSIWSVAESSTHWDEPGAPQILYVHNLPTDVHYDMQATGFRLGLKYHFGNKNIRPWIGAGFGYYQWDVNYFNETKDQTYGKDSGGATGLTYLLGLDFNITEEIVFTFFADMGSPIVQYEMEGLFYPQWNIADYQSPIMGTSRFGISLSYYR